MPLEHGLSLGPTLGEISLLVFLITNLHTAGPEHGNALRVASLNVIKQSLAFPFITLNEMWSLTRDTARIKARVNVDGH